MFVHSPWQPRCESEPRLAIAIHEISCQNVASFPGLLPPPSPCLVPVEPPSHHEELFRRGARHPAQLHAAQHHAAQHHAAQHRAAWFMQWKQMLQISKASSRSTPHVLHIERCSHNTLCVMCRKLFHFKIFTNANVRQLKAEARQVRVWFGERSQDW